LRCQVWTQGKAELHMDHIHREDSSANQRRIIFYYGVAKVVKKRIGAETVKGVL
jgi:hypothetical protein